MNLEEAKDELSVVLSELITHLLRGWFWRLARADRIQELQIRRLELLAIIANFMTAKVRSSTSTPSEQASPRGGSEPGDGL